MYDLLNRILKSLMSGSLSELNPQNIVAVSNEAVRIIEKTMPLNEYDVNNASMIISISQIVYNNTDRTVLFLDDGVYDQLLELQSLMFEKLNNVYLTANYLKSVSLNNCETPDDIDCIIVDFEKPFENESEVDETK